MVPWMAKNDDVQEERYVMVPWMGKNDDAQEERLAFLFLTKAKYQLSCRKSYDVMTVLRYPTFTALVHPCTSMARMTMFRPFLGIHAFTALVHPCTSMARMTMFRPFLGIHAFTALVHPCTSMARMTMFC